MESQCLHLAPSRYGEARPLLMSAARTISDITSYVGTGDLHIAIYDHAPMTM